MIANLVATARAQLGRAHRFLTDEIWEVRLGELPARRALGYRAARIAYCTLRAVFMEDTLHVRAAALTYFTVLSLVPLLAFAFALLKGFGAYDALVQESIRPYVLDVLKGNEALQQAFDRIIGFVADTSVTSLGFMGLLLLLYAATRLLRNIEIALNELWGAKSGRDALEQLRDYVAIIVVTPLCLIAAAALTTLGQALDLLRAAGETLGVSGALDQLISVLGPLTVLFLGFLFLYIVLPNAKVRPASAALGALIGSALWYLVLILHVRFQVGVARFNALYSSFGAIPIFLAWLQISWLVVLVGAKIASLHQQQRSMAQRLRLASAAQSLKELLCFSAVLQVTRAFLKGESAPGEADLAERLDLPRATLAQLLDPLVTAQILARTRAPKNDAYTLAKAPELVSVTHLLDALRRPREPDADDEARWKVDPVARDVWSELDHLVESSSVNQTLRELAQRDPSSDGDGSSRRLAQPPPASRGGRDARAP